VVGRRRRREPFCGGGGGGVGLCWGCYVSWGVLVARLLRRVKSVALRSRGGEKASGSQILGRGGIRPKVGGKKTLSRERLVDVEGRLFGDWGAATGKCCGRR